MDKLSSIDTQSLFLYPKFIQIKDWVCINEKKKPAGNKNILTIDFTNVKKNPLCLEKRLEGNTNIQVALGLQILGHKSIGNSIIAIINISSDQSHGFSRICSLLTHPHLGAPIHPDPDHPPTIFSLSLPAHGHCAAEFVLVGNNRLHICSWSSLSRLWLHIVIGIFCGPTIRFQCEIKLNPLNPS